MVLGIRADHSGVSDRLRSFCKLVNSIVDAIMKLSSLLTLLPDLVSVLVPDWTHPRDHSPHLVKVHGSG